MKYFTWKNYANFHFYDIITGCINDRRLFDDL